MAVMKWGPRDAPIWTIEQAMQLMSVLADIFSKNGYSLALHGSVPAHGKGNDLDLLAVPAELPKDVTPPEQMDRIMCRVINAKPDGDPSKGVLRTWSREYIRDDGRLIDMQYRLSLRPEELDWQGATLHSEVPPDDEVPGRT
jgi:hypothetical protein